MAWWIIVAYIANQIINALLASKAMPKASTLGDFQIPTAEEGRIIPVIFGTVKMTGPNVTWYGDLRTRPAKVRFSLLLKLLFGYFGPSATKYYLGMQLALCHGYIAEQGTYIVGSGSGHVAFYYSRPLGNGCWAILWDEFPTPNLPEDAVVEAIYAVVRSSRLTGPGPGANANINGGQNLTPWNMSNGGTCLKSGDGDDDWDGQFYADMYATSLEYLATAGISARLLSSLYLNDMDDDLFLTALGFAIYYTSSEPIIETGELDPPVAVPSGQGLAWTYPAAVEARPGDPGATNGLAEGVASGLALDAFLLFAGTHPDDVRVTTEVLEQTDDFIRIQMNSPKLFGGDRKEGGLEGEIQLYRGSQTQGSDPYLSSKLGLTFPAYRGLCYAVLKGCYLGTSNYVKNLNFVLRRFPSNLGLSGSVTRILGDGNPVEIIYEAMTNTAWGLGCPPSRFDLANWRTAAIKVASESLGISLTWDTVQEAQDLIQDVLRYLDGVVQTDPQTGLWTITLARDDYDLETLLELGDDDQVEAPEFTRGNWEETWNQIKLEYTDGSNYKFKTRTVQADDSANQQVVGALRSKTLQFPGITRTALAQEIAKRELKTYSYPFAQARIKANRKAWPLRVGSVFKLTWTPTGIASLVMRVMKIDYGSFEEGIIQLDAVEDVFAVAYSAYDPPDDSAWVDPITDPEAPAAQLLQEALFEWLPAPIEEEEILVAAVRGDAGSQQYEIWADEGSGYFESALGDYFAPSGLLTADYLRTTPALDATGFALQTGQDLESLAGTDAAGRIRGDCLLLFLDTKEICGFETVTDHGDGTFTFANIVRGVYDTFPADHLAGARVIVLRDAATWYLFPYRDDLADQEAGGDQFVIEED